MHALLYFLLDHVWTRTGALAVILGLDLLSVLHIPSVLLRRRGRPLAAVAWIFALISLPGIGLLTWWLVGRTHIKLEQHDRGRSHRQDEDEPSRADPEAMEALKDVIPPSWIQGEAAMRGVTAGNRVKFIEGGEEFFDELETAIRRAKTYIHILFYIWKDDRTGARIRDALCEAARRGVKVRAVGDGMGVSRWRRFYRRHFDKAGVESALWLPPGPVNMRTVNFRNHRKVVIIDGKVAFTGGRNLADEYHYEWADAMVRLEGPAVADLHEIFLDDWCFASGEVRPSPSPEEGGPPPEQGMLSRQDTIDGVSCAVISAGPNQITEHLHDVFFLAICRARRRIWISTAYFIPTEALLEALRAAALRGVDVRLLTPMHSDVPVTRWAAHSYYNWIASAGVRIFEYGPSMLHAKTMVIDEDLSIVGTANLDQRTFRLNFELACIFSSKALNSCLAGHFEEYLDSCDEVTMEELREQTWLKRVTQSAAHLISPIM